MSERVPLDTLPLFAPAAPAPVKAVHDAAELEHAAFFERVRRIVGGMYGGRGQRITTDQVWDVMERYGIKLPAGASPNLLGSFFSGWSRAQPVLDDEGKQRMTKSIRRGANGNLLRVWTIE